MQKKISNAEELTTDSILESVNAECDGYKQRKNFLRGSKKKIKNQYIISQV